MTKRRSLTRAAYVLAIERFAAPRIAAATA